MESAPCFKKKSNAAVSWRTVSLAMKGINSEGSGQSMSMVRQLCLLSIHL